MVGFLGPLPFHSPSLPRPPSSFQYCSGPWCRGAHGAYKCDPSYPAPRERGPHAALTHLWYISNLLYFKAPELFLTALFLPGEPLLCTSRFKLKSMSIHLFLLFKKWLFWFCSSLHYFLLFFGCSSLWISDETTVLLWGGGSHTNMRFCVVLDFPWTLDSGELVKNLCYGKRSIIF